MKLCIFVALVQRDVLAFSISNPLTGFMSWSNDFSDVVWAPTGGECPALRSPEEGAMVCSNGFKGGSLCKFSCERGYTMMNHKGRSSRRCKCNKHGVCQWHGLEPRCVTCGTPDWSEYLQDNTRHKIDFGYHKKKQSRMSMVTCNLPYTFKHAHSGSVRGWIKSTCKCNRKTEKCHWRGSDIPECDIHRSTESRHCDQIKTTALTQTECLDDCNSRVDCSNWLFSTVNSECFMDVCKVPTLPSYFTADLTRNQQYQKSQNLTRAIRYQTKHSQRRHML